MKSLSNVSKVIIVALVAAFLIILAIVYGGGDGSGNQNTADEVPPALMANAPTQTPSQPSSTQPSIKTTSGHIPVPIVKSPAPPVISIITPVGNDVWQIGTQNVISWSKSGGISGSISLLNGTNQKFIGTILPEIGSNQTSYTWNTLNVSLNRSDPSGKDVVPGLYEIEITYDGNNIKPITSFPFTITN